MDELSIITQNLSGKYNENSVKKYMQAQKANIYAFQELKQQRCKIAYLCINNSLEKNEADAVRAEEIWKEAFPWLDFKSGYYQEAEVTFGGKEITIIDFHSSLRYSAQMRYVLLKRISEVKNELVILLGDFNAAFKNQTEHNIPDNDRFLRCITQKLGFEELLADEEKENSPHYTFQYNKKNEHKEVIEKKKLDHIFVSKKMFKLTNEGWNFLIEYIDDVNKNFSKSTEAFTDHSGIRLTIQVGK